MVLLRYGVLMAVIGLQLLAQGTSVSQLEVLAHQRLTARDAAGALVDYEKLARLVPKSPIYEDEIGFLLAATSRNAEAIPHLRRATELEPRMAQAWYHLGVALWLAHQNDIGLEALRKAVSLAPDHADYRSRLSAAYSETGLAYQKHVRYGDARDAYKRAVTLEPTNTSVRNSYGNALVKAGDPEAGLKEFEQILTREPNNVHVQVNVGYAYIAAGKMQEAIRVLTEVAKKHSDDAAVNYDLGVAYKELDDLPHASEHLQLAIRLAPTLWEAHYTLGLTYLEGGQADKAIEEFRTAVSGRSDYVDAWYQLGTVLQQQGQVDGAIEALKHSVELDNQNAGAFNSLGLLLRKKGDAESAKQAFASAAALRKSEEQEKQKKLQQGAQKVK